MNIGILQFELLIPWSQSLKDKRRVVRSVKDRLHREHMVSVAEVHRHDALNVAVMGIACVAADGKRIAQVLDAITEKLRSWRDAELGETSRQILNGSDPVDWVDSVQAGTDDELAGEMLHRFLNRETP
ncbi:MAG TPA: DUF503 domain-containing protein [Phycisphaerales bacterium]|nr:DUF503 domain-containing protein [Phycisphaerales bacterium]